MASGYRFGFLAALKLFILISLAAVLKAQNVQVPQGYVSVRNVFALSADPGTKTEFIESCLYPRYPQPSRESASIETLIEFIQRLEDVIANTTDPILQNFRTPDMIARLVLQRFNIEYFQPYDSKIDESVNIDTRILGPIPSINEWYYFPDSIFKEWERCTFFQMLTHAYVFSGYNSRRGRRETRLYDFRQPGMNQAPTNSQFLDNNINNGNNGVSNGVVTTQNTTRELGVVSFKQDPQEAIAASRVLYGVVAGLAQSPLLSGKEIVARRGMGTMLDDSEADLKDAVLAVTIGSLVGKSVFQESTGNQGQQPAPSYNLNQAFGVTGRWLNSSCNTFYSLDNVGNFWTFRRSAKGSLAEMRGALDGYIIGKSLTTIPAQEASKLKLSTILKNYYSPSRKISGSTTSGLRVSYCDRAVNKPSDQQINEVADAYSRVYRNYISQERATLRREGFYNNLNRAVTGNAAICTAGSSTQMCETPSDVIFVVDGRDEFEYKSAMFIQQLVSRIPNVGRYGAAISVFTSGSGNAPGIEMPGSSWPLGILAFNNTNPGALSCSLNPETTLSSQTNFARHLANLNTTLTQYKWWTWRRTLGGVPSRNVVLLSLGKMTAPTSGQESDDINTYRKALKYRSRDVLFLVATPQKELFKDMVRDERFIVNENNLDSSGSLATEWAKQICQNPATLQYNECRDRASNNYTHDIWITPGYNQHWAVYPEYFRLSESLDFAVNAVDGDITVCWDRQFPADKGAGNCHDVTANSGYGFNLWKPCKGESVHTCRPIYITVRGKDLKKSYCNDEECQNLDQIKVSISHTGMRCGSCGLTASIGLTLILALIPTIFNRLF